MFVPQSFLCQKIIIALDKHTKINNINNNLKKYEIDINIIIIKLKFARNIKQKYLIIKKINYFHDNIK